MISRTLSREPFNVRSLSRTGSVVCPWPLDRATCLCSDRTHALPPSYAQTKGIVATRIDDENFQRADRRIGFGSVEMEFDCARVLEIRRLPFDGLARLLVH